MNPLIVVKKGDGVNTRLYHVNVVISRSHDKLFMRPLRESSEHHLKEVGGIGSNLITQMFEIPGVQSISIRPYYLSVGKGVAFEWKAIQPFVIEILTKVLMEAIGVQSIAINYGTSQEVPVTEEELEEPATEEEPEEASPEEEVEESSED